MLFNNNILAHNGYHSQTPETATWPVVYLFPNLTYPNLTNTYLT